MTRHLRYLFLEDFWLKLASLVAAMLIWLTVYASVKKETDQADYTASNLTSRTFRNVPVLVVSSAADVRSFKVKPNHVDVTVRGPALVITTFRERDLHVLVDLTTVGSAQTLIVPVHVSTPPGIMLVRVAPEAVEIVVPPKR